MSNNKLVPITRLGKFFSEEDFFFRCRNGNGMVGRGYELYRYSL
jgi:hypothetical protein